MVIDFIQGSLWVVSNLVYKFADYGDSTSPLHTKLFRVAISCVTARDHEFGLRNVVTTMLRCWMDESGEQLL